MGMKAEHDRKLTRLKKILVECESVCVGYSGGVDSVFLSRVALDVLGSDSVMAVTGRSAAFPAVQRDMALECARRFGIPHTELATDELSDPNYTANSSRRCYFCKDELWSKLVEFAGVHGFRTVLDGSNADDDDDYRPGFRAAREWGVRSPLLEAGLTKREIRVYSRELGLPTWDRPAAPCLSSRIPYGLRVTPERLRQIEESEAAVRALGFREFRVRHHGSAARLEFAPNELALAAEKAGELSRVIRAAGFDRVLLDVEGYRSGSLNEGLSQLTLEATA